MRRPLIDVPHGPVQSPVELGGLLPSYGWTGSGVVRAPLADEAFDEDNVILRFEDWTRSADLGDLEEIDVGQPGFPPGIQRKYRRRRG